MSADLETWWRDLGACALVGTARRPVPSLPAGLGVVPREGARPEVAALDAAALAGSLRRAGARPDSHRAAPDPAPPDERPEAPPRALQLLDLLVLQPPAGPQHRATLLAHWFRAASTAGFRLPHRLLPAVLTLATPSPPLQRAVRGVLDARGAWLAEQNTDWAWAAGAGPGAAPQSVDPDHWARQQPQDRLATLISLRAADPAAGRSLLLTTWSSDSAKDRAAHLATLRTGLALEDEDLLEAALDDRAASVRELAAELLDGLPGSARAARMAERLRPLVATSGRLRRTLEVTLPDDPDPAGTRDGLGKPPPGRSRRGWWLERIVGGAPLDVLTTISGADPDTTVQRLQSDDALLGVGRAVLALRDPVWARALLAREVTAPLLEVLPVAERERLAVDRLRQLTTHEVLVLLGGLPGPWTPVLSAAVVGRVTAEKDPRLLASQLAGPYAGRLHPDALPALESWRSRADLPSQTDRQLTDLVQLHSVTRSITEAFR